MTSAILTQITAAAGQDVPINENFRALSPSALYSRRYGSGISGLVLGYYGGTFEGSDVADGTTTLAASEATIYVVAALATGVVSSSTSDTNWNNTAAYFRIGIATTGPATITAFLDKRQAYSTQVPSAAAWGGIGGTLSSQTDLQDALDAKASTSYVDSLVQGLSWKRAVRAATTVNGTLASAFENGDTIDGVVLATNDRILIKNQSSASENGIYTVNASGAPTRATDADTGAELVNATVYISEGTTLAETQWTCSTNAPITPGSTSLTFVQMNTAGTGAIGKHMVPIMAGAMRPSVTGGCAALAGIASASGQPDIVTLDFDPATAEYAQFAIPMPSSWNEGTVTFRPIWSHTTATGAVVWELQAVAISDDDTILANFGTVQSVTDSGGTANDIYIGAESPAVTIAGTPAAGDVVFFRVSRNTSAVGDTLTVDARLHGIQLFMTTDAEVDA